MHRVPGTDCQKELQTSPVQLRALSSINSKKKKKKGKRLDKAKPVLSFRDVPTDSCKDVCITKGAKEEFCLLTAMRDMK
jgi:hypothetical protein